MKTHLVTATVVDEVCIAERHGAGNQYLSLDYIPGTTLWGAIAALTGIRRGEQPSEWFRRVFYSGEVVFTNLYPRCGAVRAHPVPLSARTLKSAHGFRNKDQEPIFRDHKVQLFPGGDVVPLDAPSGTTPSPLPKCQKGVEDWLYDGPPLEYDADWEPKSGWYIGDPPQCESVEVKMVLHGHNDRAGRSGVTREGLLFTRQNIPRGNQFQGALRAHNQEGAQALETLIQNHLGSEPFEISIGRQPGCVHIQLEEAGEEMPLWQRNIQMGNDDDSILTVTLLSDALLLDRWLRPLSYLPAQDVATALGLGLAAVDGPVYHFSALREVSSWNSAYSRPRETELAVAAGSAFLYLVDWPKGIAAGERLRHLKEWQQRGIGLRTAEGFGEIRLNHPFHCEYRRGAQDASRNE